MERVDEIRQLKELLVEWGMDEARAKDKALTLVYPSAFSNHFFYELQFEQESSARKQDVPS
jgi:hypothetical protein